YPQSMARTKKTARKVEVPFQGAPSEPKVNEQTKSKFDEQRQSNVDEKNKSRSKVPFGKAKWPKLPKLDLSLVGLWPMLEQSLSLLIMVVALRDQLHVVILSLLV
ncbi:hypothetical protein L7F22_065863, partial [Adiantum nelumboides]|nr:hypothetical protein [Adiantum nelumboides]